MEQKEPQPPSQEEADARPQGNIVGQKFQADDEKAALLNYVWPAREAFDANVGRKAIDDYIQGVGLHPSWLWATTHVNSKDGLHQYRLEFGQPGRRRPVPFPTVNVYFEINTSATPTRARFVVEDYNSVYKTEEAYVREEWLQLVGESKMKAIETRALLMKVKVMAADPEKPCDEEDEDSETRD